MPKFLLSPEALKNLEQIGNYTLANYGQQQKKAYFKMLRDRMREAAKKPDNGQDRSDIKAGYFSIRTEKHHIYYRVRDTHIEIIDVLHQSMKPNRHL